MATCYDLPLKGKHVSLDELCCHDERNTPYPTDRALDGTLELLVDMFEAFREHCGGFPLKINCAYRTEEHNRAVGGTRRSMHLQGKALDIACPKQYNIHEFHMQAEEFAKKNTLVGGLGLYWWGVHMDIRPRKTDGGYASW